MNSGELIVLGHTPNLHLMPSSNDNDQTNPFPNLPFSSIQSLRKSNHLLPCDHSPSKFLGIPYPGRSIPWKCFLASKGPKTKAYPCLKTIILGIACSWKSMDTIGYQCPTTTLLLKCFTSIMLIVPITLLLLLILAVSFN